MGRRYCCSIVKQGPWPRSSLLAYFWNSDLGAKPTMDMTSASLVAVTKTAQCALNASSDLNSSLPFSWNVLFVEEHICAIVDAEMEHVVVAAEYLRHGQLCFEAEQIDITVASAPVFSLVCHAACPGQLPAQCGGLIALMQFVLFQLYFQQFGHALSFGN
mgnify:CR=1 FL=1